MNSHPVFSDFSHIAGQQGLGGLTFAVGLRTEDAEEAVKKMLPLCVITPGVKVERVIRKVATDTECERPDCLERKEMLSELDRENDEIRTDIKTLEGKIASAKNKIVLTSKTIAVTEEKNDVLKGEIDEAQNVIFGIESEVDKANEVNRNLRDDVAKLQEEVNALKLQADEHMSVIGRMTGGREEVIFARTDLLPTNPEERKKYQAEIARLAYDKDDDSDDD
jgi:chromosome segregation ATPase